MGDATTALDDEVMRRRAPTSGDGMVLEEGDIVHLQPLSSGIWHGNALSLPSRMLCKKYTVCTIEPFRGGAWDIGGNTLELEPYETEGARTRLYTSDDVCVADETFAERPVEEASCCEMCCIHFHDDYVKESYNRNQRPFFKLSRGLELKTHRSACERCLRLNPQGRTLWNWVARVFRARGVAMFWYALVHTPKFMHRIATGRTRP